MKLIYSVLVVLLCAAFCFAADYEYKVPLDDPNVSPTVCLPDVGKTVRLVCPIRYHEDWPIERLGPPFIYQTWSVPRDYERPYPFPPQNGTFDIEKFKQQLVDDGRAVEIEFVIPDQVTAIQLQFYMTQYSTQAMRIYAKLRQYTIMVRPSVSWDEKVKAIPLPLAPGL